MQRTRLEFTRGFDEMGLELVLTLAVLSVALAYGSTLSNGFGKFSTTVVMNLFFGLCGISLVTSASTTHRVTGRVQPVCASARVKDCFARRAIFNT